jgi:hypothetical protein
LFAPVGVKRSIHREDAKSAKMVNQEGRNAGEKNDCPVAVTFQQAGLRCTVQLEQGVHDQISTLLDLLLRLVSSLGGLRVFAVRKRIKLAFVEPKAHKVHGDWNDTVSPLESRS